MIARRSLFALTAWGLLLVSIAVQPARGEGVRAVAFVGKPFGVGRVEFDMPKSMLPEMLGMAGLRVTEQNDRALYPSFGMRPFRGLLRNLLDRPQRVTLHFLFPGDGPLELTLEGRPKAKYVITPRHDSGGYREMLRAWWKDYTNGRLVQKKPDAPPMIDNYLQSMLAARMQLPLSIKNPDDTWQSLFDEELGLAAGTDKIRLAMQRARFLDLPALRETADQPLPLAIEPVTLEVPDAADDVKIEPIALRVPTECLYVRFGSFANFLWFQDTLARWGGDLQNLVALRGIDYHISRRIEEQLVLKQTALSRLMGPTVVADVAFVGTDIYLREGAAIGILFEARMNNPVLGADFVRHRAERLAKHDGIREEKVTLVGREVSLLSTPDGRVRSYYAHDGAFHFMTTSRTLARRFLETSSGDRALGTSRPFRHARTRMPIERGDAVFVYLSDPFFRNLLSPRHRIETARRMQALADIETVELAMLAAATEGFSGGSIEELSSGGYLPFGFGLRPDGSQTEIDDQGVVHDSVRGYRGALLPVPDVPIDRVTPSESAHYARLTETVAMDWERFDPVLVGIQRKMLDEKQEQITIDARLSPFASKHQDLLNRWVGPADDQRLVTLPDDVASIEAILSEQRVFGGVANLRSPFEGGGISTLLSNAQLGGLVEGYLGCVGRPAGLMRLVDRLVLTSPDSAGFSRGLFGLWRRDFDPYTLYSFQPEVLEAVPPQLRFEPAERPAQLRIRIDDLSSTQIIPTLNKLGYNRTCDTSRGNLYLLHQLSQQLHVPGEICKDAAELLLDGEMTCPLGGEYEYRIAPDGTGSWVSTALDTSPPGGVLAPSNAPEGFVSPPLNWFRGLKADVLATPESVTAYAEIRMQLPE